MNSREFFDLTAEVLDLQKEFFKTRDAMILRKCKKQEKKLRDEIERVRRIISETARQQEDQLKLFKNE